MSKFSAVVIGNESLAIQCAEMLLEDGHDLKAVVTRNPDVRTWAEGASVDVISSDEDLTEALGTYAFDWLLSIANLDMIPQSVLALPKRGAVNFHDGPLPRYAGLNAPVWALINGESEYGISWHMIEGGVDEGRLLAQQFFDITTDDTVLTLNTKCYGAAMDSFSKVLEKLAATEPSLVDQDLSERTYFAKNDRPPAAGRLNFNGSARKLTTLVRALDHGGYWNPLTCPKFEIDGEVILVGKSDAGATGGDKAPGTVIEVSAESLTVATGTALVTLSDLRRTTGTPVAADAIVSPNDVLASPDADEAERLDDVLAQTLKVEGYWRRKLQAMTSVDIPMIDRTAPAGEIAEISLNLAKGVAPAHVQTAFAILIARTSDTEMLDIAVQTESEQPGYLTGWVPVQISVAGLASAVLTNIEDAVAEALTKPAFSADLLARIPGDLQSPSLGLSDGQLIADTALTLSGEKLLVDTGKVSLEAANLIAARLGDIARQIANELEIETTALTLLPAKEHAQIVETWNATETEFPAELCTHEAFEAQVERTPDAEALSFEGESLTYAELNARANQMAHKLIDMGVGPDVITGLHLPRSTDLVVGALAIMKAGGAYLPMDPSYPADRTALYIEDSGTQVIITSNDLAKNIRSEAVQTLIAGDLSGKESNPTTGVNAKNLAYMIYTSGSTGRPKGVMVEHRNVSNFFVGMDARIPHKDGAVWMAVTSLSFDISVLELFWTLARGFKVVISGDESRALVAGDSETSSNVGGMDFSLYYWGNDDGVGSDKYRTLLEGAKFGDKNGFCAVWTPERHFHAFGGPYPNPSVTGAAVAAITENLAVRAGSCVAPLHHTARIAEEWAVIDNLTNGRTGLAIASGWQPDDFVLRPENTPPDNKPAMFDAIRDLRKLWAGEKVAFPRKDGTPFEVLTQPRPVSKRLNVWVTTAGNPATWKEAGANGANVLTHLLGQSVEEVGEKIKIYHQALRDAGHDPDDFTVTLMLHSFLADTQEAAREIAREPMKDYLRSAAGLIKQYAWAFPAFKKPKDVDNAFQLDLGSLTEEELEGILDFAFERYFNDSGLFGTVEDALQRVEQVKAIGVTEIACLIDYGIEVDTVLEGLTPLAEVVKLSNVITKPDEKDYSIAAQIARHKVTHLQCTPSMAQMLVMNDEARSALRHIDVMMVGGEALPGALARDLMDLTGGHVENMYGPTETTIWSTTHTATGADGTTSIGTPIANTQVYVLAPDMTPAPIGVAGELFIGGDGVTRGYFQREDLTAERFVDNPFRPGERMYRTGDLARWALDGTLDFLGRADFQVKLRGYRIELGEIECVIDQFDGVQQSVVVAREDGPNLVQLVGYLLTDGPVDDKALRAMMLKRLPDHMVPRFFVELDAFPLTPNKKVDRNALPAPVIGGAAKAPTPAASAVSTPEQAPAASPQSEAMTKQAAIERVGVIWSRMLGVPQIAPTDNFFELGGHSLLAVQAHREIRAELGVTKLSITDIFRAPVLDALADIVVKKSGNAAKPARTAPAAQSPAQATAKRSEPAATSAPIPKETVDAPLDARQIAMNRRREMRARRQSRP
ncbi:MAG: MupA/Atu3671 family FMN-dependent luciferase-like monooxygenase [Pseudomonadota bacterium]